MRAMSTPMTLERYAEIRAEMEAGRLRDEVLARTGITVDEWSDAQRTWLVRMGMELERGRFELTNRYTQAFLERQRALQATTSPASTAVAPPVSSPTTAPLPPLVVPTPLPFKPAPPPPVMAPPMAPPPIAAMPPEVPLPAATETADDAVRTVPVPFGAGAREVLPFTKGPSNFDEPSLSAAPAGFDAGATQPLDGRRLVEKDALPFTTAPSAVRSTLGSEPDALDQDRALPNTADEPNLTALPSDFDAFATLPFDRGPHVDEDVLPFTDASSDVRSTLRSGHEELAFDPDCTLPSTAQSPLVKAGPVLPFVTPTEALRDASPSPPDRSAHPPDRGSLSSLQAAASPSFPEPAHPSRELPSGQPTEEMKHVQGITLSQYAQICAAVRASPDQVAQIRSHYGIDTRAWVVLHTLWQERFQRDPTLKARWQTLIEAALARRTR
jgi:hypothetical protein